MSIPSCSSSSADNFLSNRLPAQVDEARQHAVLSDAAAEVGVLLLAQPGGVGLEEGGVAEDDVPGRVVDGRGEVHVQLVHRRLRLAQEGEGRAQPVVQGRREIHAHLGDIITRGQWPYRSACDWVPATNNIATLFLHQI